MKGTSFISLPTSLSGLLTHKINVNTLLFIKWNKDTRVCFDAFYRLQLRNGSTVIATAPPVALACLEMAPGNSLN